MNRLKKNRFAIAAFICMMGMGITTTGFSLFIAPVSEALDVGRATFTIYYSLMAICGAITAPMIGNFVGKKGVKLGGWISCIWIALGLSIFSFSNSIIMFYIVGFMMGLFSTDFTVLCANVTVQNHYEKEEIPTILGVVMAGSGVGGILISLVMPHIVSEYGWRYGYRVLALIWFIFRLVSVILLGEENKEKFIRDKVKDIENGMTKKQAIKTKQFYIVILMTIILTLCCGVQQYIPDILANHNFDTKKVAALMAILSTMIALGKILLGRLYSKFGIKLGGSIAILFFIGGFACLFNSKTVYIAVILVAIGLGVYTTLIPLIVRHFFGNLEYAQIWGIFMLASSFATCISSPAWGTAYDYTESYTIGIVIAIVLLVLAMGLHIIVFTKKD